MVSLSLYTFRSSSLIHNCTLGELYIRVNVELARYLDYNDLKLQPIVAAMLSYMNPNNRRIRIDFVRPIIMIAHEHKMSKLVMEMEQFLVDEPPITLEVLQDHLELGQRFGLKNLINQTLLRIEVK